MKWPGVFLLPPGWDATCSLAGLSPEFNPPAWGNTMQVKKCPAHEHYTITLARVWSSMFSIHVDQPTSHLLKKSVTKFFAHIPQYYTWLPKNKLNNDNNIKNMEQWQNDQTHPDKIRGIMRLIDHAFSILLKFNNSIAVSWDLCLKSLMLLKFSLKEQTDYRSIWPQTTVNCNKNYDTYF